MGAVMTGLFPTTIALGKAIAAGHAAIAFMGNVFDVFDCVTLGRGIAYQPELTADEPHERGSVLIRYSKSQSGNIHRLGAPCPRPEPPDLTLKLEAPPGLGMPALPLRTDPVASPSHQPAPRALALSAPSSGRQPLPPQQRA
jgi:hypothetical protein